MTKKNISELLGITDDWMFQHVLKNPINCKGLLQAILPQIAIKNVEVHTQERVGTKKGEKYVVLDVWVKDDQERLYNIEMQVANKENLPQRARYNMHALDEDTLHSGEDYKELKNAYVIFITPFDPIGLNRKELCIVKK